MQKSGVFFSARPPPGAFSPVLRRAHFRPPFAGRISTRPPPGAFLPALRREHFCPPSAAPLSSEGRSGGGTGQALPLNPQDVRLLKPSGFRFSGDWVSLRCRHEPARRSAPAAWPKAALHFPPLFIRLAFGIAAGCRPSAPAHLCTSPKSRPPFMPIRCQSGLPRHPWRGIVRFPIGLPCRRPRPMKPSSRLRPGLPCRRRRPMKPSSRLRPACPAAAHGL